MLSTITTPQGQERHRQPAWASTVLSMVSGFRASWLLGLTQQKKKTMLSKLAAFGGLVQPLVYLRQRVC